MSFEETELSWNQFLSSGSFLRLPFRTLALGNPPPVSLAFVGCTEVWLAILPRRELEEALLEIGLITDVINEDFDLASVFLLLSTFLLLLGGLNQQKCDNLLFVTVKRKYLNT